MYLLVVKRVTGYGKYMKYIDFPQLALSTEKLRVMSLTGGVALCAIMFSAQAYAQDVLNLLPDQSAVAEAPADLQQPPAVNNTLPTTEGAGAPLETEDEAEKTTADGKKEEKAEVGDSLPKAGLAPEGEEGADEFSFDDSVEYEKSPEDVAAGFRKQAFDAALDQTLPLKPSEIRTVLEHYDRTIQSTELPVHPYPRAEQTVQNVALDPGTPPVVIKLSFGYVTTLSILDITGAPWPIEDISWVGDFEIHEDSAKEDSHILRISPSSNFAHGNMSMRLKGLDTPVIFTFETNRDMVHYRFDALIQKEGPQNQAPIIDPGPVSSLTLTSGDVDMSLALGGVVPEDAERLLVSGVDGRTSAYRYNGLTYVRTPLALLSPGWESSVASADGTRVYALQDAPVLILSDKGRMVRARLSDAGSQ